MSETFFCRRYNDLFACDQVAFFGRLYGLRGTALRARIDHHR